MLKVALIGYGTIGRCVLKAVKESSRCDEIAVTGVLVRDGQATKAAACGAPVFERLNDMLAAGRPDIVIETATQDAVVEYGESILAAGCDLLITSSGALTNEDFLQRIRSRAQQNGQRILIPSGAIGGVDAIAAMRIAGLTRVTYRSRKPPVAWRGSAAERIVALDSLSRAETFFRGTARDAARTFPKNANVAATIALAGLGMDQTAVELVADPTVSCNIHEIEAEGASGQVSFRLEGAPFPDNPRSSMLTAYSVARTLLNLDAALQI